MKGQDLVSAYGIGAEAMKCMADLARQIKKQGGREEDIRLLNDEKVLRRVARVLAGAGNSTRHFDVLSEDQDWARLFLMGLSINGISQLEESVATFGCRLATKIEMGDFYQRYSKIFYYDDDLIIVGGKDQKTGQHQIITSKGVADLVITDNLVFTDNYRFAVVFN